MQTADSPFLRLINNPAKAQLFLLRRLPAAYASGVRIRAVSAVQCTASIPYNWFTKNPFRSTYFACLSMAAEMSTGALAMAAVYGQTPPVSMLVTGMESKFLKKATGTTFFTCSDGPLLLQAVEQARTGAGPQVAKAYSKGVDAEGTLIAEFWFTWSFRVKALKPA
jgi:hypothetical protein